MDTQTAKPFKPHRVYSETEVRELRNLITEWAVCNPTADLYLVKEAVSTISETFDLAMRLRYGVA